MRTTGGAVLRRGIARGGRVSLNRRGVLAGAAAMLAAPRIVRAADGDVDVVVVGAGSAGLAAATTLTAAGRSVAVLEAAHRIGGRAVTDTTTFGLPFDRGCSWLHSGDINPYTPMARAWGFDLLTQNENLEVAMVGSRRANGNEEDQYGRAWRAVNGALSAAGREARDVPASEVIPADMPWAGVCQTWIGPMDMGKDLDAFSPVDWWNLDDTDPNIMVRQGFGTLVARYGAGVPVTLDAPVTAIDWSGRGVTVTGKAGTVRARAAIVTVSTGVLAAEVIRFTPALPTATLEAIDNLPMGLLCKVPLQLDGTRLGLPANQWLSCYVGNKMPARACYFLTFPFNMNLLIGFLGGSFGWELSAAGRDTAIDFAKGELRHMFGNDVGKHIVAADVTEWASYPWTRGAYASVRPGGWGARAALARPVGERVFFAGEALGLGQAMTCGGAYLSGKAVAGDVMRRLDGSG